jgi:glycosyltransferase involved in cell wall biosynthesis
VFPSLYEGFGLTLLEAMHCGAAVVAGNNSSQVEVVGEAGLLANANDAGDIAAKLARVLEDEELARSLRARAVVQADQFSWSTTAARATAVLEDLPPQRQVIPLRKSTAGRSRARPRIAFFSPFPPRKSGVSDYSALLLQELKPFYEIDLYHESGYVPEPALAERGFACCDARLFPRQAAARDYHAVVYQMGNSRYHHFMYETMLAHPGIVTLHDFCLAGFHLGYGFRQGRDRDFIRKELHAWYPDQTAAIAEVLDPSQTDWEEMGRACARRGWFLNRRVIASARRVVVHSPWCLDQLRRAAPEDAARTVVIPHGIWPRSVSAADRAAIRARFDIPPGALLIASFGFIHPDKMSPEALDAFGSVAQAEPSALFVFGGEEADGGAVRRHAAALGLPDRIRFLGRQAMPDFTDLIAATDVGINLRRPPTNGETSGALLYLLASGVATIVTDVATFSDYPGNTVWKVDWESEGFAGLERALRTLATDRSAREALGRAALSYTREHHEWPRVAKQYVETIESSRENPWHARQARRPILVKS